MSGFSGLSSSFWALSAELNGALPFEKSQKSLRVARSPQNLSKTDVFSGQESNQTEHIDSYGQGPGFYSQCHRKPDIPENRGTFLHHQRLILTGMVEPRQARGAYLLATWHQPSQDALEGRLFSKPIKEPDLSTPSLDRLPPRTPTGRWIFKRCSWHQSTSFLPDVTQRFQTSSNGLEGLKQVLRIFKRV